MFKRTGAIEILLKCIFMIALVLLFVTQVVMPQYEFDNHIVIRQKYDRLCEIKEPKIVLAGNSNVWFGYRSDILQQELGMPTVNFGVPAPLGAVYALEQIKDNINPGDIVIFNAVTIDTPLSDKPVFIPEIAWGYFEKDTPLYKGVLPRLYGKLLEGYPIYFRSTLNSWMTKEKTSPERLMPHTLQSEQGLIPMVICGAWQMQA